MWERVQGKVIWEWKQAKVKEKDKTLKIIGTNSDSSRDHHKRHTTLRIQRKTGPQQDSSASVLLHAVLLFVQDVPHSPYCRHSTRKPRGMSGMTELYVTKVLWGLQGNAHTSCRAEDTYRATDAVAAAGQREVNMGPTYTWEKQRGKLTASWMWGCACVQNEP